MEDPFNELCLRIVKYPVKEAKEWEMWYTMFSKLFLVLNQGSLDYDLELTGKCEHRKMCSFIVIPGKCDHKTICCLIVTLCFCLYIYKHVNDWYRILNSLYGK